MCIHVRVYVSMKKGFSDLSCVSFLLSLIKSSLYMYRDPALICIKWNIFIAKLQAPSKFLLFTKGLSRHLFSLNINQGGILYSK